MHAAMYQWVCCKQGICMGLLSYVPCKTLSRLKIFVCNVCYWTACAHSLASHCRRSRSPRCAAARGRATRTRGRSPRAVRRPRRGATRTPTSPGEPRPIPFTLQSGKQQGLCERADMDWNWHAMESAHCPAMAQQTRDCVCQNLKTLLSNQNLNLIPCARACRPLTAREFTPPLGARDGNVAATAARPPLKRGLAAQPSAAKLPQQRVRGLPVALVPHPLVCSLHAEWWKQAHIC